MFIGEIKELNLSDVTVDLPENEAPDYSAATIYNISDEVIYNHSIYGCLVNGTAGKRPDLHSDRNQTPQYWQRKSPTNAFACVDGNLSTPTRNGTGAITVTIVNFSNIAGVGIFDAWGSMAVARFYDSNDTLVDTQVTNLTGFDYSSYYAWLFTTPSAASTNHIFRGFPTRARKLVLRILGTSTRLGEVIVIQSGYNFGRALMGSSVRIASRAVYEDDPFGVPNYKYRPARVNASFELGGDQTYTETIWGRMRALSGRPVVYEAAEGRSITTGAGLVRDINVPIELPDHYVFTVEIEGVQ